MQQTPARDYLSASLPILPGPSESYYRARYYDPQAGRFLTEDPIRLGGGIDFYKYVANDPSNFIDPLGTAPGGPCLDIGKFVDYLDKNAFNESHHRCAQYFRKGLEAGGLNTAGRPDDAKNYGPFLQKLGFTQVSPDNYTPQPGDAVVLQNPDSQAGWPTRRFYVWGF
jgi:hypothetical protein